MTTHAKASIKQTIQAKLSKVHEELLLVQQAGNADKDAVERAIETIEKLQHGTDHVRVAVIGVNGAGKSILINRILGNKVVPARNGGVSRSNAIIKIYSNPQLNTGFKVEVRFFDLNEMSAMIQPELHVEEEGWAVEKKELKLKDTILTAIWDDLNNVPQSISKTLDLIPPNLHRYIIKQRQIKEFDDVKSMQKFIKELSEGGDGEEEELTRGKRYLVREIAVYGDFPVLQDSICLMDIPGSGDTPFLTKLQANWLEQSDAAIFIAKQAHATSKEVMNHLQQHVYQFEKKMGFALCMTRSEQSSDQGVHDMQMMLDNCLPPFLMLTAREAARFYLQQQTQPFLDTLTKTSGELSGKLKNMELFLFENGPSDKEAEFSKQERTKFVDFVHSLATNEDTWKRIDGVANAAIEDIKTWAKTPLVSRVSDDDLAAIRAALQDDEEELSDKKRFLRTDKAFEPLSLDLYRSNQAYRQTLRETPQSKPNLNPCIPIWGHIISSTFNMPEMASAVLAGKRDLFAKLDVKLEKVRTALSSKYDQAETTFIVNRLRNACLYAPIASKIESSASFLKAGRLESLLANKFGSQVPCFVKGTNAVEANKVLVTQFLVDNAKEMQELLVTEFNKQFFTLDRAFDECTKVLSVLNESLSKPIAGFEHIVQALEQDPDEPDPDEPDNGDPDPAGVGAFVQLCQKISNGRCQSLAKFRWGKPPKPEPLVFYLAYNPATKDKHMTKIGISSKLDAREIKSHAIAYSARFVEDGWVQTNYGLLFKRIMTWLLAESREGQSLWFTEDREVIIDLMHATDEFLKKQKW